jgi:hypothetical protein
MERKLVRIAAMVVISMAGVLWASPAFADGYGGGTAPGGTPSPPGAGVTPSPPGAGGGLLAFTGAHIAVMVGVGAIALALGGMLVLAGRRRVTSSHS